MFTGIIEALGEVAFVKKDKGNITFTINSPFAKELKEGQSVAHNGVCLTVERLIPPKESKATGPSPKEKGVRSYIVTAVKETFSKTNLGKLKIGDEINLERSLKVGDRLDGHFVQGHVDTTAIVKSILKEKGSWLFKFQVPSSNPDSYRDQVSSLIIEKGSVCVNGVSLTVVETNKNIFAVAIIPHTFLHTNFKTLKVGEEANIEFDILGKHIHKILSSRSNY